VVNHVTACSHLFHVDEFSHTFTGDGFVENCVVLNMKLQFVCFNGERKEGDEGKKGTDERTMRMKEEDTKEIILVR